MSQKEVSLKFRDISLSVDERVEDLLAQLTLPEKVAQMIHQAPAIPRLGIEAYDWWNEGLHGVGRAGRATVFPQAIGLAASFNPPLLQRVVDAISDEARAKHHQALRQGNHERYFGLTYWSPNINIFRDPRWGRGQETYGEDPYLTGRLGVAFVKGLQGDDPEYLKLVATPKHYAVHSGPEPERHRFDAVCSQRDLRETYLRAFKECVQEAGAWSIMGAYNRTNGEPCCGSPTLLGRILREEWGFEGFVVSDCWAIRDFHQHHKITENAMESSAMAVRNGCDLNCGSTYPSLVEAVERGLLDEAAIDLSLRRLLRARFRLGMFDPPHRVPYAQIPAEVVECPEHRRLARRAARESMVLLKNDSGLLPLSRDLTRIAVVGPNAVAWRPLLGNYYGYAGRMITPFEGIVNAVSVGTDVKYAAGCSLTGEAETGFAQAENLARSSDAVIAVMGYSPELEGEEGEVAASDGGGDRRSINLPGRQEALLKRLHELGKPVILVVTGGSCLDLAWAGEHLPAIVMAWYPGAEGGNGLADVLFGDYNPAGRLPITFEPSLEVLPPFADYSMKNRTYRFADYEPLFPFGYGLSYTRFEYSDLALSKARIGADEKFEVAVRVGNVGGRDGDEVVQLYVSDLEASVAVPRVHLEGVARIHLRAGESQEVRFLVRPEQLACYDDDGRSMVEPGEFRIFVGGGQPDYCEFGVGAILTVV